MAEILLMDWHCNSPHSVGIWRKCRGIFATEASSILLVGRIQLSQCRRVENVELMKKICDSAAKVVAEKKTEAY